MLLTGKFGKHGLNGLQPPSNPEKKESTKKDVCEKRYFVKTRHSGWDWVTLVADFLLQPGESGILVRPQSPRTRQPESATLSPQVLWLGCQGLHDPLRSLHRALSPGPPLSRN